MSAAASIAGTQPFGYNSGTVKQHCVVTRPMEPKKRSRGRQWRHRPKVSSTLSKDFPWEVVLRFLSGHARSLILLQMVDKNLNHLISTDNKLWLDKFKREIKYTAYCIRTIQDPIFPNLRLWKPHINGLPVYTGPLRGDPDDSSLGFAFDACFSSYVRRVYALKHGTRCGMCGCRHRHDPYWSLRMRVCRLCMEGNSISGELLSRKYGVDYSDLLVKHKGKFFYYSCSVAGDDRVSVQGMTSADVQSRRNTYMFWLPHLKTFLDLPALCQQQSAAKQAAVLLSNALKRRWGTLQRNIFGTDKAHYSVDCLLLVLYRNEKKRLMNPEHLDGPAGGSAWAFTEFSSRKGTSKFTARNGEPTCLFRRLIVDYEDWVV